MTRSEILKVVEFRMDGLTWEQIADKMHYTTQHLQKNIRDALNMKLTYRPVKSKGYPELAAYITRNYDGKVVAFAGAVNVSCSALHNALAGKSRLSGPSLEKIRRVAGNIV